MKEDYLYSQENNSIIYKNIENRIFVVVQFKQPNGSVPVT